MLSPALAVCAGLPESVTFAVNVNAPAAVGVPEIAPELAFSESPVGNWPEEMLHV